MTSMINFYSDTQTLPSRPMRESCLDAPTGDERHNACPTTNLLCERVADLFGMESAVFMPSGTMCNEVAIAVHCRPGDEVICARQSHIIFAESGGPAALSGVMINPIDTDTGIFNANQFEGLVRADSSFAPRSRLLVTEQTSNLGGGAIWPMATLNQLSEFAKGHGLAAHMDGARILNAVVASGISASDYAANHDSAWISFTKGLGCPVGAVLAGSRDFIRDAWLFKRRWGGAMRQTGILTAMCLYALDHHVERLADDHDLARYIRDNIAESPLFSEILPVETNIILCRLKPDGPGPDAVKKALAEQNIKIIGVGKNSIRIVTHMDVNREHADQLIEAILALPDRLPASPA